MKYYRHKIGYEFYRVYPDNTYDVYYNGTSMHIPSHRKCKWHRSPMQPFNYPDRVVTELTEKELFLELL